MRNALKWMSLMAFALSLAGLVSPSEAQAQTPTRTNLTFLNRAGRTQDRFARGEHVILHANVHAANGVPVAFVPVQFVEHVSSTGQSRHLGYGWTSVHGNTTLPRYIVPRDPNHDNVIIYAVFWGNYPWLSWSYEEKRLPIGTR